MNKAIISAIAILLAPHANADLITWGPVQDATSASDVSTAGTLVTARNCFPQGMAAAPTINGIMFAAFSPQGWNNGGGVTMNMSTSGDAGYDAMLDGARATSEGTTINPTDWGAIRLDTLGTFTLGASYEIQVWYCEQRTGSNPMNPINDRLMTISSATGVAVLAAGQVTNLTSLTQGPLSAGLEGDPNNMAGAGDTIFGQFVTGTFSRSSTDELWLLVQGNHPVAANTLRPHINGFQIREVSQSSTFCNGDGGNQMGCTDCPCGNNSPPGTSGGCLNSAGNSSRILQSGSSSVTAGDLRFEASGTPSQVNAVLTSGGSQAPANIGNPCFGLSTGIQSLSLDGLRCVVQGVLRHGARSSDMSGNIGATNTGWGNPDGFFNLTAFTTGQSRHFQIIHGDNLTVCQTGQNTSQGITVNFQP